MKYNNVENRLWILEKIENQIIKEMNNHEEILKSKLLESGYLYMLPDVLEGDHVYTRLEEEREQFYLLQKNIKEIYEIN